MVFGGWVEPLDPTLPHLRAHTSVAKKSCQAKKLLFLKGIQVRPISTTPGVGSQVIPPRVGDPRAIGGGPSAGDPTLAPATGGLPKGGSAGTRGVPSQPSPCRSAPGDHRGRRPCHRQAERHGLKGCAARRRW